MQMTIRKSISFPRELVEKIQKRADENQRSFSAQVVYDMGIVIMKNGTAYWTTEYPKQSKESNE